LEYKSLHTRLVTPMDGVGLRDMPGERRRIAENGCSVTQPMRRALSADWRSVIG